MLLDHFKEGESDMRKTLNRGEEKGGRPSLPLRLVLLLSLLVVAGVAAKDAGGMKFFYCIHSERPCKETTPPVPVVSNKAMEVTRRALATKDDFVGFVDSHDTTLQFKAEGGDSILVDLPVPKENGSYDTRLSQAQALKLIGSLSPPLARYRSELKLKFAKWE
jgi:hypothetical protein